MNWQPIETAPKDGTWIIVTCGAGFIPAVVKWNEEAELWMLDEHIDDTWAGIDEWPLKYWMPMDALPTAQPKPAREFRWEQSYETGDGWHWALKDTATDARAAELGTGGMVSCPYMVLNSVHTRGVDGRPLPEQYFPKLIIKLLNEYFSHPKRTGRKSMMHCQQCGEIRGHDHKCTETQTNETP